MPRYDSTQFTKSMLKEHPFPGLDAATLFLPEHQPIAPEIQQILNRAGQSRFYPIPGGNTVKIASPRPENIRPPFKVEPKGWDHEHCDFCNATIDINQTCWSADFPTGGFAIFCKSCRDQLRNA
jgi:hypothetical protein